jgi:hypothetical protein
VALTSILDDILKEGAIASVTADQIHTLEASGDEHIQDSQPEILKSPAASV